MHANIKSAVATLGEPNDLHNDESAPPVPTDTNEWNRLFLLLRDTTTTDVSLHMDGIAPHDFGVRFSPAKLDAKVQAQCRP